jgi:hypothetical protein
LRRRRMEIIARGFLNATNATGLEMGLIFLTGSVLLLLIIMVAYFRRVMAFLKGPKPVYKNPEQIREWVEESENVFKQLSETLEQRKEIANRLIAQLDLKIGALRSMMAEAERVMIPIAEEVGGKEKEAEVLEMAEGGQDFLEIARQTGLSVGEVQFIMNLKKCQQVFPFKIA